MLLNYTFNLDATLSPRAGQDTTDSAVKSSQQTTALNNSLMVPYGTTLVFTAFDRLVSNSELSGTGSPSFWALGGTDNQTFTVEHWVVVLRASLLDLDPERDPDAPGPVPPSLRRPVLPNPTPVPQA